MDNEIAFQLPISQGLVLQNLQHNLMKESRARNLTQYCFQIKTKDPCVQKCLGF